MSRLGGKVKMKMKKGVSLLLIVGICLTIIMVEGFVLSKPLYAQGLKLAGWPYEVDTINENLAEFEKQYGVAAQFESIPSDAYHDKLIVSFIGGTDYDVVYVRDWFGTEWIEAGWLVPLEGYPGVEDAKKDFPQFAIDAMSHNGKLYGLPYYSGNFVSWYNKKHLEKAGIASPPRTWEELVEQAKKIKALGIVEYPVVFYLSQKGIYITEILFNVLSTFGDKPFDDNNQPIFNKKDNKLRNVLQLLKEMFDIGILNPTSLTATDHDCVSIMSAGQATFSLGGSYNLKTLNDPTQSAEAGNIEAMLNPGGVEGVRSGTEAYIRFYAITKNSDQKEDAWKLVKFLGWKDKNGEYYVPKKWALRHGLGFVQKGLFDDPEVEQSMKEWIDPKVIAEQYEYVVDTSYKFTSWYMEWLAIAKGEFQKAMLGKETIDNVLNNLAREAEKIASAYK